MKSLGSSVMPFMNFQVNNDWDFIMTDNPLMKYKVKSCSLPFLKFGISEKKTGQKFYKDVEYPGSFTLELYETTTYETYRYFKTWQDLIFNPYTQTFNSDIGFYEKSAILIFNNNFLDNGILQFMFSNLKLVGADALSLNYSDGGPLSYNINLTADTIEPLF
jgi:hypothetical protein